MRIALDAMGGDDAPKSPVAGAVLAAREYADRNLTIILVGKEELVRAELARHDLSGGLAQRLPVVNATEVVGMEEHPAQAVRRKKDSSVVVGLNLLKKGEADAFVSAGHSGATMAGATLGAPGRIRGVERPALATVFPAKNGPILVLDVGANTEVKPEYLVQFAQMGVIYAQKVLKKANPRVGLLSNGEEENKGSLLVQETHQLLKKTPDINFGGNVEGKDVPAGEFDVVVTDGFTGNVLLKTTEGVASLLLKIIREELTSNLFNKVLALLLKPAFKKVRSRMDYEKYGGAPLLGVNGIVIITHGRMSAEGIKHAIRVAGETFQNGTVEGIRDLFTKTPVTPIETPS
ncbi:MAG: Phosphate acyltransferase [Chloroflexi bacterium]|nr:Phosphate acyltransferase [Chloroflexota bacterium]